MTFTPIALAQITSKTNHFGLVLLALLLVDRLKESAPSRMVWVASPAETFSGNIDWSDLKCASGMAPWLWHLIPLQWDLLCGSVMTLQHGVEV